MKDDLKRWWDGLTGEERADALGSREGGRLSDAMERSLVKAGLIKERKGRRIPDHVQEHLDEQSGDGADTPPDGGKMRH